MTKYISREAVLSKCADIWNNADETTQTGVDTINTIDKITDFIESLPAADVQPIPQWISVDEKLPKPFERVLCYCISTSGDDAYMIGCINKHWGLLKGETFVSEKETHRIVAYWQPLPSRPTIDYCHFCNEYLRTTKRRIENDTI